MISKKGSTAVTFITRLAVVAMMVAVAAMFVIISVFSGLEDLNRDMVSNLHPDLTIQSTSGKTIEDLQAKENILRKNPDILHFSKMIEEKVYVSFAEKGEIAYLRGVDSAYTMVNPIDKTIFYGAYPSFNYSNEVLMENSLAVRLAIPVNSEENSATILMPKPGKGLITKEEDIYNKKSFYVTGVFPGQEQLNNYIVAPIELLEQLLELPKNSAYKIVIKLKDPQKTEQVKADLLSSLGKNIEIKTKAEENAAFWKMINTEKLFIYLIFALVVFITTFNLAGAIIILQLDKKEQSKSLIFLGYSIKNLRKTYFLTGVLIVATGIISGLFIGSALCIFQLQTGFFGANASGTLPFPVRILSVNYIIVTSTAAVFGLSISWIFSKINKQNLIK